MAESSVTTNESAGTQGTAGLVERNVRVLLEHRSQLEQKRSNQERIAHAITRFIGSMWFVYIHLAVFALCILSNVNGLRGWLPFESFYPTFVTLAMIASVEAIFLSTFVLITQNRMAEIADRRADLDLQVSLLSEHEITKLIELVVEIAKKMNVEAGRDPELTELSQRVAPEKVLDTLEETERMHAAMKH